MALIEFRFSNGTTVQIEMGPVEDFRDDLLRQVARGDNPASPESLDHSKELRDGLMRMSSQQLVLLVTELSHVVLAYGREIKRLTSQNG
jgi:hypothetical protein